jgi:hypothetical protein
MIGDGVLGFNGEKSECEFSYLSLDEQGWGGKVDDGHYRFTCQSKGVCGHAEEMAAIDASAMNAIVVLQRIVELTDKQRKVMRVPLFKFTEEY